MSDIFRRFEERRAAEGKDKAKSYVEEPSEDRMMVVMSETNKKVTEQIKAGMIQGTIQGYQAGCIKGRIEERISLYLEMNYPDDRIRELVIKRFKISDEEFDDYMKVLKWLKNEQVNG